MFAFAPGPGGVGLILGFQAHGGSLHGDIVALSGVADRGFDQAVADHDIAQAGGDVMVSNGTTVLGVLHDVALGSLQARDFRFA